MHVPSSILNFATAKFKLELASSGAPVRCDKDGYGGELECGRAVIRSYTNGERIEVCWDKTVTIAADQYQGWDMISAIWTVSEKEASLDNIKLRFYYQHKNMNVFFDDQSYHIIYTT